MADRINNVAAFYAARILTAVELAKNEKWEEALNIYWDLRLQPDLNLYHRALVNLFLANYANASPDELNAFARETLSLIDTMRQEHQEDLDEEVLAMERHAHRLLDGSFDEEARQEQQAGQSEYDNKKHDDNAEETDDEEGGDNDTAMSGTDENHKEAPAAARVSAPAIRLASDFNIQSAAAAGDYITPPTSRAHGEEEKPPVVKKAFGTIPGTPDSSAFKK